MDARSSSGSAGIKIDLSSHEWNMLVFRKKRKPCSILSGRASFTSPSYSQEQETSREKKTSAFHAL
jgi:hypothetical protein